MPEGGSESHTVRGKRVGGIQAQFPLPDSSLVTTDTGLWLPRIRDINENCLQQFRAHWECLEQNNHQLWHCRRDENALNTCVFEKIVCFADAISPLDGALKLIRIALLDLGTEENHSRYSRGTNPGSPSKEANLCK
jgi:CHCH domain